MTYKEILEHIRNNNLLVADIDIAFACDCTFDFEYTDEQFEQLCSFASNIYLKTENIEIWEIAQTINRLVKEENVPISKIIEMGKWEFIDQMPI